MSLIIGIDPGITGALAALDAESLALVDVVDMPTLLEGKKRRVNGSQLGRILRQWKSDPIQMVYLEQVHSMPGQGVASMFSMGRSFGSAETAVTLLGLPLTYVSPVKWKRRARLIGKDKDVARTRAIELYPNAPLSRKKDHNRADAMLIARYGAGHE